MHWKVKCESKRNWVINIVWIINGKYNYKVQLFQDITVNRFICQIPTESARNGFMLFLDEVLVSGRGRKGELIAENNLEWGDHEWIQFKLRFINYRFPFRKDRLWDSRVIWTALMNECRRDLEFLSVKKWKKRCGICTLRTG